MGRSAYSGCDKCEQHAKLRTDMSFAKHHNIESPLNRTSIALISQVPHDYMHFVCLGVMRKLKYVWIKGASNTRLGPVM